MVLVEDARGEDTIAQGCRSQESQTEHRPGAL